MHAMLVLFALSTFPSQGASGPTTLEVLMGVRGSDDADYERGIAALRRADVASDVREARARNDRRLIGMSGIAPFVPGLSFGAKPPSGYSVVRIAGTSDAIRSKAQAEFQTLLQRYATAYNVGILGLKEGGSDEPELQRLEQAWNEAHRNGDAAALEALWAEDLVVMVPRMAPMTREIALAMARSGRMKFERYETSAIETRRHGDTAIVTGRLERAGRAGDRVIEDHWQFTKVYVRDQGRWRVVSFHASEAPAR